MFRDLWTKKNEDVKAPPGDIPNADDQDSGFWTGTIMMGTQEDFASIGQWGRQVSLTAFYSRMSHASSSACSCFDFLLRYPYPSSKNTREYLHVCLLNDKFELILSPLFGMKCPMLLISLPPTAPKTKVQRDDGNRQNPCSQRDLIEAHHCVQGSPSQQAGFCTWFVPPLHSDATWMLSWRISFSFSSFTGCFFSTAILKFAGSSVPVPVWFSGLCATRIGLRSCTFYCFM